MVDAPPTADKLMQAGHRVWELPEHRPNLTQTRGAFKTYSTYVLTQSNPLSPTVALERFMLISKQHSPQVLRLDSCCRSPVI